MDDTEKLIAGAVQEAITTLFEIRNEDGGPWDWKVGEVATWDEVGDLTDGALDGVPAGTYEVKRKRQLYSTEVVNEDTVHVTRTR